MLEIFFVTGNMWTPVKFDHRKNVQHHCNHCLPAVHGCQLSVIELFQSPLMLVPGTLCHIMSCLHHLCQFSVVT